RHTARRNHRARAQRQTRRRVRAALLHSGPPGRNSNRRSSDLHWLASRFRRSSRWRHVIVRTSDQRETSNPGVALDLTLGESHVGVNSIHWRGGCAVPCILAARASNELQIQNRTRVIYFANVPSIPKLAPEGAARSTELRNRDTSRQDAYHGGTASDFRINA